ncbi:class II aldolase/adducin family protein [Methylovirgula sp. 4M-Z18]|uniref:class II aldolase/adducin family protein n=1 Tax=Methylovirgula sp. 4M-Z18 TaxID=2293567 RepID=UPI000E2E8B47|nr:class II aldolase/adducin family protein [Methylovirgula sp. 4M-Z18]RFB79033.1 class II aldolase [Methylovirgula sp. 4M-Z18]
MTQADFDELQRLQALSAKLGADPLRTQGAGGNTSLKQDDVLWIKASGTWLAHALERNIMVPVHLPPLRMALAMNDPRSETAVAFVDDARNPDRLRPSIETSVHALIPHAVVAHFHCVETIALAVRKDCEAIVASRLAPLQDVAWTYIPYRRPGLPLAKAIAERARPQTNVLILGNHGLVVAGATVAETEDRIERVCAALRTAPRPVPQADLAALERLVAGTDYRLPHDPRLHGLALDPVTRAVVQGGSLYPDHVIFLGPGVVEAPDIATGAAMRQPGWRDEPPLLLSLPGQGVVPHRTAKPSAEMMALCLLDVAQRLAPDAELVRLSPSDEYALTHWEAEKYRQALDTTRTTDRQP